MCNSLLKQNKYQEAEKELKAAVFFDQKIAENQLGGGMAYCFLLAILENKKDQKELSDSEEKCVQHARPEMIAQYQWFIENGKRHIADRINTKGVVNGESKPSTQP